MTMEGRRFASRSIGALFRSGTSCGLSDADLLERFLAREERHGVAEDAFEALVLRHGPMVLDVCRNVLGRSHDAEDAFQATFLILATKADSVRRRSSVASWLYGVALRTASRSKADAARRRVKERRAAESREESVESEGPPRDFGILHEEVGRLPSKYRDPLILCYFEGMSQEMAAQQLRCPAGTVGVRLMRAKSRLKDRLDRRGESIAPAVFHTPVSGSLVRSTVQSAIQFAEAGPVSLAVAQLTKEVSKAMFLMKLKQAAAAVLVAGTLASGAGYLTHIAVADGPPKEQAPDEQAANPKPAKPRSDLEELQGMWLALYENPVFAEGVVKSVVKRREKWIIDGNFISTVPEESATGKLGPSAMVIPFKLLPHQPSKDTDPNLFFPTEAIKKANPNSLLIPIDVFPDLNTIFAFRDMPTTDKSGRPEVIIPQKLIRDQPVKKIDLRLPGLTNPILGIYELYGDWLRICYMPDMRPEEFVGDPNKFKILVHLKRIRPPAQDATQRSDLEELQGTWATKVELNYSSGGKPQPTELINEKWVASGDTIRTFPRPTEKQADMLNENTYLIKLDPNKTHKTIDLTMPALGTLEGIYEIDGDSLKICCGFRKRPTAFVHDPKNNSTLFTLKRLRRTPEEIEPRFAITPGCYWAVYPSQPGVSTATTSLALMTDFEADRLTVHLASPCERFDAEPIYRPVAFDTDRKRYPLRQESAAGVGGTGVDGKNIVVLAKYRLDKNDLGGKKITHVGVEFVTPEAREREKAAKAEEPKAKPDAKE